MTFVLALLLVVSGSVQYAPDSPTIGDLITITYPDPGEGKVSLLPDDSYEVVSVEGNKAVVRTFRPGTLHVVAEILTPGQQTQRHAVDIEVRSVLAENDDLQPAPLVLPKQLAQNTTPLWAIGLAAAAALIAWALLYALSRRLRTESDEEQAWKIDPAAAFLERLNRISRLPDEEERWRQLADSTRWLLPTVDPALGRELTTSEILERMRSRRADDGVVSLVDRILHGGDWAKFSPFGAPHDASASVIHAARELARLVPPREEAA